MVYQIDRASGKPIYEQLYEYIRRDILEGRLCFGEKLPSKREAAERLGISVITVENAYSQLIAEGYVRAEQRSGYFVQYSGGAVAGGYPAARSAGDTQIEEKPLTEDNAAGTAFPFTVWARLMRSVILEKGASILRPVRHGGAEELCAAISDYLYRARGFYVPPRNIIVGAGTEYLYNLIVQLLGREQSYGIENPGYEKLARIYELNGISYQYIGLDGEGMIPSELEAKGVTVAHISPAHHFPTGIVMPISRRREIMDWAERKARFILEDDYDSEFRWSGKPVPTMFGMDSSGRVIYVNTFSQTIAPSVRISYMCLPDELRTLWERRLGFYSCPVPAFEQYTLARFISEGYFERHINRAKKRFRHIRELVLSLIADFGGVTVSEENAGLHFTASVSSPERAESLAALCGECGIKVTPLSFYYSPCCASALPGEGKLVVSYAGADEKALLKHCRAGGD